MYRCEQCNQVGITGEKQHKKVIKTRVKYYKQPDGTTTVGSEIVKEIKVCERCKND